jgi:hypothetical protein
MTQNTKTNRKTREPNPPVMIAYAVSDTGRGRKFWTRLGGVWGHKNGEGLTIYLNVLPIDFDGRVVLLPPKEEEKAAETNGEAGPDDEVNHEGDPVDETELEATGEYA